MDGLVFNLDVGGYKYKLYTSHALLYLPGGSILNKAQCVLLDSEAKQHVGCLVCWCLYSGGD